MYCDTIPYELAVKLKQKGMRVVIEQEWYPNGMPKAEKDCHKPMTTYAQVFDWFAKREIFILINPFYKMGNGEYKFDNAIISCEANVAIYLSSGAWNEAADAAIERALELIKEEK